MTMLPVHILKLTSGETLIVLMKERGVIIEGKTEIKVMWVVCPMVLNVHAEIRGPWVPGIEDTTFPIRMDNILFYAEEDSVNDSLIYAYRVRYVTYDNKWETDFEAPGGRGGFLSGW